MKDIKNLFRWALPVTQRASSMLRCRKHFGKSPAGSNYPFVEPFSKFSYTSRIIVGYNVSFLQGAIVLADKIGLIEIGDNSTICRYSVVQSVGGNILIGRNSVIGDLCSVYGQGGLKIGEHVMISSGVRIVPNQHTFDDLNQPIAVQPCRSYGIIIKDDVWVGTNATILDGITVGTGAVIGAGSIVTNDVPDFAVVAGVPARILRYRTDSVHLKA